MGNRSLEYDSLGDRYARFLIEELLPDAQKPYRIVNDPAGRARRPLTVAAGQGARRRRAPGPVGLLQGSRALALPSQSTNRLAEPSWLQAYFFCFSCSASRCLRHFAASSGLPQAS
jgi:hypothetical protein